MTESSPGESKPTSQNDAAKKGVREKVVVSKSSAPGAPRSPQRPVVIRKNPGSGQAPLRVTRNISRKSGSVTSSQNQPKVARKPITRHGKPNFSSSIITDSSAGQNRKRESSSMQQRLFFDAAIAVVALSFMVLTFLHL